MNRFVRSAGIVAMSTAASRVLGLARDVLMASFFSANASTDAFYAAFRIPNLFRRLVGEGVLTVSFIPVYTEYLIGRKHEDAIALARKTLTVLLAALSVLAVCGWIFAPQVIRFVAMGFTDPSQIGIAATMFRTMIPYLIIAGFLAFCMGFLNAHRYFFAPAFSPVLLNVGILSGILVMAGFFPVPLYGVSAGVIIGGLLQAAFQAPYLVKAGFKFKFDFDVRHPGVRKIFRTGLAGILSMGSQQINILVATFLASFLAPGCVSYIYFSDRLHELVVGLAVVSIGNVVFPEMSRLSAQKNIQEMMDVYSKSISATLFMAIPASVALMVVGYPVISVLLVHSRFTALEAEMTFRALFFASAGIVAITVTRITMPVYFSLGDMNTPLRSAAASFAVNAISGILLMRTQLGHGGLTLGTALAASAQTAILVLVLKSKAPAFEMKRILKPAALYGAASAIMGLCVWGVAGLIDWNTASFSMRLIMLAGIVVSGSVVYFFSCLALRAPEARSIAGQIAKWTRFNS